VTLQVAPRAYFAVPSVLSHLFRLFDSSLLILFFPLFVKKIGQSHTGFLGLVYICGPELTAWYVRHTGQKRWYLLFSETSLSHARKNHGLNLSKLVLSSNVRDKVTLMVKILIVPTSGSPGQILPSVLIESTCFVSNKSDRPC